MQKTVIRTHERIVKICDICQTEDGDGHYTCRICGRDVCLNCSTPVCEVRMWRVEDYGDCDYPTMYCKSCWEKGQEFRERLNMIDEIRDAGEEAILNAWKEAVK
jgi:hypothetical protein